MNTDKFIRFVNYSLIGCIFIIISFIGWDWLLRENLGGSFIAPTAVLLWQSLGVGAAGALFYGVVGGYAARRGYGQGPPTVYKRSRFGWRRIVGSLRNIYVWLSLLSLYSVVGWCEYWSVFCLPAISAMYVALFIWIPIFKSRMPPSSQS